MGGCTTVMTSCVLAPALRRSGSGEAARPGAWNNLVWWRGTCIHIMRSQHMTPLPRGARDTSRSGRHGHGLESVEMNGIPNSTVNGRNGLTAGSPWDDGHVLAPGQPPPCQGFEF